MLSSVDLVLRFNPPLLARSLALFSLFLPRRPKVTVDVDSEYTGVVIDRLTGSRRGVMMEMKDAHEGKVSQRFALPWP